MGSKMSICYKNKVRISELITYQNIFLRNSCFIGYFVLSLHGEK